MTKLSNVRFVTQNPCKASLARNNETENIDALTFASIAHYNRRMFPIVELTGNAFERGYAHGVQARTRVAGSIRCYSALFAHCGMSWKRAQQRASEFREVIAGCGDVFDEIDGIAAGSGFHLDEILALNCRTEILPNAFFDRRASESTSLASDAGECTSFAVAGRRCADGATRIGQNWDWLSEQRQHMVILRVKNRVANWADYLTLTEAGIVAKIGVNSHGLAIGLNILRGKKDQSALGIPVHVFQRMALDNVSVDNVVKFARSLRFCCSSNAVLGDATGRVVSLEYGSDGVAVIEPDQDVLAHTNHFCDAQLAQFQAPLDPTLTTEARLDRANQHLTGWPDRVTTRNLTTFLRDDTGHAGAGHAGAICRTPDRSLPPAMQIESVCGVILNCDACEMLVAPGLPTAVEFESVAL